MRQIWTVGHSTHPLPTFLALLEEHSIEVLTDVRRFAGSRRHPQFGAEALREALESSGITYVSSPSLGGRRTPRSDSRNDRWRNAAFRGYADYMESAEFSDGIDSLSKIAETRRTAVMCAEGLWWRCHRALISDYLKARGWQVLHIMPDGSVKEHPYTQAAFVSEGILSYSSK